MVQSVRTQEKAQQRTVPSRCKFQKVQRHDDKSHGPVKSVQSLLLVLKKGQKV